MPFRLIKKTAVVVGTFNIYIIQPGWLQQVGLVQDEVEGLMLETDLSQPGFKMLLQGVVWRVEPTRITLESKTEGHDFGATLNTIFDKLPWTPLRAMGFNAEYEAERAELRDVVERWPHPAMNAKLSGGAELTGTGWDATIAEDPQRYNFSLFSRDDKFRLSSNVHTELAGHNIDFAKNAASNYLGCQRKAAELAALLYQVTIDDIRNN